MWRSMKLTAAHMLGITSLDEPQYNMIKCDESFVKYFDYGLVEQVRLGARKTAHVKKLIALSPVKRKVFDASNPEHRAAYLIFQRTGKWMLHFYSEWPSLTVPHTIEQKLVARAIADDETGAAALKLTTPVLVDVKVQHFDNLVPV